MTNSRRWSLALPLHKRRQIFFRLRWALFRRSSNAQRRVLKVARVWFAVSESPSWLYNTLHCREFRLQRLTFKKSHRAPLYARAYQQERKLVSTSTKMLSNGRSSKNFRDHPRLVLGINFHEATSPTYKDSDCSGVYICVSAKHFKIQSTWVAPDADRLFALL